MSANYRFPLVLLLVSSIFGVARAQYDDLVTKIPSSANVLVLMNAQQVNASSAVVREELTSMETRTFSGALTLMSPDAKAIVLAAKMDLELMVPLWTCAILSLDRDAVLKDIERHTGGTPDRLGKYDAIALPGDAYLVQFAPRLIAVMAPANRQAVSQWVRELDKSRMEVLSPYLAKVLRSAEESRSPVTFAIDLEDCVTSQRARELATIISDMKSPVDLDSLVALVTGVRGASLTVTLEGDEPAGKLSVDFGTDVRFSPEVGKKLVLETLSKKGAMLHELDAWTPTAVGKELVLGGTLTASGIRRLSSVLDRPPSFTPKMRETDRTEAGSKDRMAKASQDYWRHVQELLADLKKERKTTPATTMGQVALWMDSYARRIDQLPVENVDPELAAYGGTAAESLRKAGQAIKEGNARKRIAERETPMQYDVYPWTQIYGYSYRWNWFGSGIFPYGEYGVDVYPNETAFNRARSQARMQEHIAGAVKARQIMKELEDSGASVRYRMAQKYDAQF